MQPRRAFYKGYPYDSGSPFSPKIVTVLDIFRVREEEFWWTKATIVLDGQYIIVDYQHLQDIGPEIYPSV